MLPDLRNFLFVKVEHIWKLYSGFKLPFSKLLGSEPNDEAFLFARWKIKQNLDNFLLFPFLKLTVQDIRKVGNIVVSQEMKLASVLSVF